MVIFKQKFNYWNRKLACISQYQAFNQLIRYLIELTESKLRAHIRLKTNCLLDLSSTCYPSAFNFSTLRLALNLLALTWQPPEGLRALLARQILRITVGMSRYSC